MSETLEFMVPNPLCKDWHPVAVEVEFELEGRKPTVLDVTLVMHLSDFGEPGEPEREALLDTVFSRLDSALASGPELPWDTREEYDADMRRE
jgi:hypothetical protein